MTLIVFLYILSFTAVHASVQSCGRERSGFQISERAGCMCRFDDGSEKCISRMRKDELSPYIDMQVVERGDQGSEYMVGGLKGLTHQGGCYQDKFGDWRMTMYFNCDGGRAIGFCNVDQDEKCCNTGDNCESCNENVDQCDSIASTMETTIFESKASNDVTSNQVSTSVPISIATNDFVDEKTLTRLEVDPSVETNVQSNNINISLGMLIAIAVAPMLCVFIVCSGFALVVYKKYARSAIEKDVEKTTERIEQGIEQGIEQRIEQGIEQNVQHFEAMDTMPLQRQSDFQYQNIQQNSQNRYQNYPIRQVDIATGRPNKATATRQYHSALSPAAKQHYV